MSFIKNTFLPIALGVSACTQPNIGAISNPRGNVYTGGVYVGGGQTPSLPQYQVDPLPRYTVNPPSAQQPTITPQPLVDPHRIEVRNMPYYGAEAPGTIVILDDVRKLYYVENNGTVTEYPIATARANVHEDYSNMYVGLLRENPSWHPTDSMVGKTPTSADNPENPLGEYAINLNRGGKDTLIRIHGTRLADRKTIGTEASSGCFRMLNEHVRGLFYKVKTLIDSGRTVRVKHHYNMDRLHGVEYPTQVSYAPISRPQGIVL